MITFAIYALAFIGLLWCLAAGFIALIVVVIVLFGAGRHHIQQAENSRADYQ